MLLLDMFIYRYILIFFLIIFFSTNYSFSEDKNFNEWLVELEKEAIKRGISKETFNMAMENVVFIEKVKKLDKKQPERVITFNDYYERTVNKRRIEIGKKKFSLHKNEILDIANKYGVQARFILAIWGIETNYGTYTGSFSVISSLTTLAYKGRRAKFFRLQLLDALKILDEGHIELANMKGSWAGAMGQSQFMPSSFQKFAVDFDNDGRRDIWTTNADVFASASNYLINSKWKTGQTWGREVRIPKKFDYKLASLKIIKSLEDWQTLGVRKSDGSNLPKVKMNASLIIPSDVTGKSFLIYENYRAILRWNRSHYFAMAVGHLADAFIRK